ncbi:hypothetical protein BKA83DRAFT_4491939 [Pisolithus microcarpus]|nr:hypothetical protein BKA83DRAFT_4491939 [Pisolithus microcarpus]
MAMAMKTQLSRTPKRQWGLPNLDPPTPSEGQDYEECEVRSQSTSPIARDQTAVIVNNKYSDMETAYMFDTQCVDTPMPAAINLKQKWDDLARDDSEVTSKTFVHAIDMDEPHGPPKEIGLKHYSTCHQVQKLRLSITPSVASDSVLTSNFPKSETMQTSSSGSRFTNTLLLWVGDQLNIWSIPEDNIVHALREIIKVMYPTFMALDDICPNTPIFSIASQCLSRWRHSLGSTAIALLDCYFASDLNTDIEQMCEASLCKCALTYEDLDSSNLDKAFHGAFILQLLANAHLHSCAGSVDIPALHLSPKQYRARGVIALCVTALKHAIKLTKSKSVSVEDVDRDDDLITLHTNLPVWDGEATTIIIPDLCLDLWPPGGLSLPIWAMESGFSSTLVQMCSQLKAVADIVPELDAAFLVSVCEAKYTPPPKSILLYTLQPIPPSAFVLPTHTLSFGPVVVEGITWISIDSITFKASLQCEDGWLRFGEGPLFAKGHLFPDLEMKGVDRLLDLAVQHFLQHVAEIMEGMPGVDASRVSQVQSTSQMAAFPTHWTKFLHKLQEAVWDTAYC